MKQILMFYMDRNYRCIAGCGIYFCPVRKMDAIYLLKYTSVYWLDVEWTQEGHALTAMGLKIDTSDLRSAAMRLMRHANDTVIEHGAQLDQEIDMSFDDFERRLGVGSYGKSVAAARRKRFR